MGKREEIGAHVKIAFDNLCSVKALGFEDRNSCMILFYAAENLLMATFKAEGIPNSQWRGSAQHQIDRMVDLLPDECLLKERFRSLDPLTAYATTYRYPTVSGKAPQPMTAQQTGDMARNLAGVLAECRKHFGVNLKHDSPKALHSRPLRAEGQEKSPEPQIEGPSA